MPYPMLNKHSQKQYLELETVAINLFTAVQSLMTITEGEDLDSDSQKLIHFGAKGYGHNYSAAARKSFRARHKCDSATDILSARYWACRTLWGGAGKPKQSSPKSRKGKY